jgi:disulfide bond formation protein DsbB
MMKFIKENSLGFGLIIALAGMIGSLYFSEVMGLVPCLLCWYQRVAMYPLVVIFAAGLLKKSNEAWDYAVALIIVGLLIGIYQFLLVQGLIAEPIATCSLGVPCSKVDWSIFGFITIPFLSLLAWLVLGALYMVSKKK